MPATVNEVVSLRHDVGSGVPTIREKTAAAAFIAQFYGGIENILKRIHRYHGISLPTGDLWHIEIFQRFCLPNQPPFPLLFDDRLNATLAPYRKFRHVVHHGYGMQLDWERMTEGVARIEETFRDFRRAIEQYLANLS
jgi:hypothetical protein